MPEPQDQTPDQGPWTKYGASPPAAPAEDEGPWSKFSAPAAPPKPPEKTFVEKLQHNELPSLWETAKHFANPVMSISGDISEVAGKAAEWASKKRTEAEQQNLAGVAAGKPPEQIGPYSKAGTYDLANRALRTVSGLTSPSTVAITGAGIVAPEIVGPALIAHGGYNAIKEAPAAFRGDPEATERMLQSAAEATGGAAASGEAVTTKPTVRESLANTTTGKATSGIADIGQRAIERLKTPEAQKAFTQAIQPGVRIPKAQDSIAIAGPRIQQIREAKGIEIPQKGPEALKAVLDLNREAKTQILQAIEDRLGPVADMRPNASEVANGIRSSVDDLTVEQTPGLRESMERRASTYDKDGGSNWSIRQMENRMHTLNNRLASTYSQATPGEARISAETEMDLAEAGYLRKLIDRSVENLSGEGVKDLKREYGAQRDIEKGLARQYAVATRVKGAPLWEGLAYLQAAGDLVTGGVWGAAKAAGRIAVGNRLQNLRDAGYLANQAFHGKQAFKAADPIPPHQGPPAPKGLLSAPATPLPDGAPDTSGPVRGGRYTTPAALLPGEKPIEAEFIPRRVPTGGFRAGTSRMLPESTTPQTNIPPAVSPEFAREVIGKMPFQRTEQGPPVSTLQRPVKGELPAPKEGAASPKPPTPAPKIKSDTATKAMQAVKRGGKAAAEPAKPTAQLEKLEAGKTPAYVAAAAKEAGAMPAGYQPGEHPGMGFFQFHDPELGGSFYIREGQVSTKAIKDAMEARKKTIQPSPLVAEKTANVQREMARREAEEQSQPTQEVGKLPPVQSVTPPEDIAAAEGTIRQEVDMLGSMDKPGRYFDQSTEEEHTLAGRRRPGERMGGMWRGVKSARHMMPFLSEHPEVSPSKAADALQKDGTNPTYQKLMRAALEFIKRKPAQ